MRAMLLFGSQEVRGFLLFFLQNKFRMNCVEAPTREEALLLLERPGYPVDLIISDASLCDETFILRDLVRHPETQLVCYSESATGTHPTAPHVHFLQKQEHFEGLHEFLEHLFASQLVQLRRTESEYVPIRISLLLMASPL